MQTVLIDNINYQLDPTTHTASVYPLNEGEYSGEIVIPSTIIYNNVTYGVTSIWGINGLSGAFSDCEHLKSVIIPNSITSIGEIAFWGCENMISIIIPSSITKIEDSAFAECKSLTSIIIPHSVNSIGDKAFSGCDNLTSIIVEKGNSVYDSRNNCNAIIETATNILIAGCPTTIIPNSVTCIGIGAFAGCEKLTSIIIPESVTSIEEDAFCCTNLVSITIPKSVTSIGEGVFDFCNNLRSIVVEEGNTVYDSRNNCNAIVETATNKLIAVCKNITIPNGITHIGTGAFFGVENLVSITIPKGVVSIGGSAFSQCGQLTSVSIPESVISIGDGAFWCCGNLVFVNIPRGVTSINDNTFGNCRNLASIIIPDNVTYIGYSAFLWCEKLSSIIIPNGVVSIGACAFADCKSLTSITIPDSVTNIGDYTFSGCTGLTSIIIPDSVTSIEKQAFKGCKSLEEITLSREISTIAFNTFGGCQNLKSIAIHNKITTIENQAFYGCGLTSINIPKETIEIGKEYVFGWCDLVTMVVDKENPVYDSRNNCNAIVETKSNTLMYGCQSTVIPNGITRIEKTAFYGCWRLKTIAIPNSVESIGQYAFADCSHLATITIPNSVNAIEKGAFKDCEALSSIRIPQGKKSIFDADDLKELQDKIIEYTPIQINGVQYELDSDLTAIVCAKAEKYAGEVVVPMRVEQRRSMQEQEESVQNEQEENTYIINRLGERAFADCYELTAVTLPKSITEIGKDVFLGCENLQTIRVPQGMTDKFCQMGLEPWRDKIVEPRQEEYTILLNIARGYELGIGMARNLAQAVLCYAQAADKGCAEAAYHLGELYADGKGLPQDYQQAADWFGKAAALYHPNGAARQQECLHIIEQETARLAAFEQEQQAARQAQLARITAVPQSQKTILFFDTETNGLPRNYKAGVTDTSNWPRLIQIGWLITDEAGNILKRKSQLIYPHFTIDADVTRLTGITTAQAQREGTDLARVLREFAEDAAGASLIVGHNIDFDLHVVGCELYRESMDYRALLNKPTVCTMQRSTNFCAIPSTNSYYSGYKYPTLTELYTKLFGRAFSGAHDALTDITATKDCYFELRRRGII